MFIEDPCLYFKVQPMFIVVIFFCRYKFHYSQPEFYLYLLNGIIELLNGWKASILPDGRSKCQGNGTTK